MAKLVYTDQSGREMTVPLGPDSPVVSVGRATDCTIRSNRKSVSRRHAEFHFNHGQYQVVDLNSSNGTYLIVDDRRQPVVEPRPLHHQDEVWCGDFILRFFEEESDFSTMSNHPGFRQDGPGFGGDVSAGGVSHPVGQPPSSGRHRSDFNNSGFPQRGPQSAPAAPVAMGMGTPPPEGGQLPPGPADTPPPASGQMGHQLPAHTTDKLSFGDGGLSGGVSAGVGSRSPSSPASDGVDTAQLQRLRDEKESIQQLCDRQSAEINQLRQRNDEVLHELRQLQSELEEVRQSSPDPQELQQLRDDLEQTRAESRRLQEELELARQDSLDLDDAQQRAHDAEQQAHDAEQQAHDARQQIADAHQRLADASQKIDELRQQLDTAQRTSRARIDDLQDQLERTTDKLDRARQDSCRDEVSSLREEAARLERLLGEFERRNRDLQLDLDDRRHEQSQLHDQVHQLTTKLTSAQSSRDELQARLAALEPQLAALQSQRDELLDANDAHRDARQHLEAQTDALRSEIEGLKQRLRLEKERARANSSSDQIQAMQAQIDELHEQLAAAEAADHQGAATDPFPLDDLATHARALDRIVDAIERTDLSALSTVDRVRLQSAIRKTQPRQTLSAILELVGDH